MKSLSFSEFKKKAQKGNLVPIFKEIPADLDTPVSAFMKIQSGKHNFLLESVEGGDKWARYSFLGTKPRAVIRSRQGKVELIEKGKRFSKKMEGDPLYFLEDYLSQYKAVDSDELPRFSGGAVGYLAYDMLRYFEKIPATAKDELQLYDYYFLITDTLIVFDNLRKVMSLVVNQVVDKKKSLKNQYDEAQKKIDDLHKKLKRAVPQRKNLSRNKAKKKISMKPLHQEKKFCSLVDRAKEYIKAGDIFQVQISNRFQAKTELDPFKLYRSIRRINPSPYLFYYDMDDIAIVGASPEVMVRLEDEKVEVRPIAGTRRRGYDYQEDLFFEEELKNDPKELAEHIMLVDLGRNDVGRVSQIGSVHVDELEIVERYSHVMHLVSHVSGKIKKGKSAFDVIRATFPAGTLTGAPKIRSMEIIEELEGRRRGLYGGCVGYISFNQNMDFAITIRTALFKDQKVYVQAAGGIVYDSIPRMEFKESQNKARAMLKAIEEASSKL